MGSSRALRRHSNQARAAPDPAIRRFPAARGEHEASVHSHAPRPFRAKVDHYEMRRPRASHTQELRQAHPLDAETKRKKINDSIQGLKGPRCPLNYPPQTINLKQASQSMKRSRFLSVASALNYTTQWLIAVRECLLRSAPRSLTAKLTGGIGPTVSSHLSRTDRVTGRVTHYERAPCLGGKL